MTLVTHSIASAPRPRWLALLGRWASSTAERVVRGLAGWQHRRDAARLAGADAHILSDLGLSRADVRDALSGPPWEDPTVLLRARALERRLGRLRVCHGFPAGPSAPAKHEAFGVPATRERVRLRM